ncbi:MAG: BBP7 family outer membrane beta-barrel protein [Gemmataceae bacterium]|nr:BBP7 family outer membrane beta-barrel protein [Gemmataceae bacterium]
MRLSNLFGGVVLCSSLMAHSVWAQGQGESDPRPSGSATLWENQWAPVSVPESEAHRDAHIWGSIEYLMRWVKAAPFPVPILSTGNPLDAVPGALGQPGTVVLFGGSGAHYNPISGGRVTVGTWLGEYQVFGIEASGFLLDRETETFAIGANGRSTTPVYVPTFRPDVGRLGTFAIADPVLGVDGSVILNNTIKMFGGEVNGLFGLACSDCCCVSFLTGVRYFDLAEEFSLLSSQNDPVLNASAALSDRFGTHNQFYGGQIGLKASRRFGRATLDVVGKLAVGMNHETVAVAGSTALGGPGNPNPGVFPGGIFAEPTNIGVDREDKFAFIPEVQIRLGIDVTPFIRVLLGYEFLYMHRVVRPGDQIDSAINSTQQQGRALVGEARPARLFNQSEFWMHGANAGVELRY